MFTSSTDPDSLRWRATMRVVFAVATLLVAIFLVSLVGGRRGELCGFQWGDVDWPERSIWVRRQLVPAQGGGNRLVPHPKGKIAHKLAIGDVGVQLLLTYQDKLRERLGEDWKPKIDGWLISYDGGTTPVRVKGIGEYLTRIGSKLEPPLKVTPHSFRHFNASSGVQGGIDLRTMQKRLGHSNIAITEGYLHSISETDQNAASVIGGMLDLPVAPTT